MGWMPRTYSAIAVKLTSSSPVPNNTAFLSFTLKLPSSGFARNGPKYRSEYGPVTRYVYSRSLHFWTSFMYVRTVHLSWCGGSCAERSGQYSMSVPYSEV